MTVVPELEALEERRAAEQAAYAEVLAALDALAAFELPLERLPDQPRLQERLNALWESVRPALGGGWRGRLQGNAWAALAPLAARQQEFNSALVRLLNGHLDETARLHARLRDLVSALVRWAQRVEPMVDVRDRVASALATTRSELVLEAFDRRLERLGRRLEGLLALRDRLEALSEEVRAVETALRGAAAGPPAVPPARAAAALAAAEDSRYVAFGNRYRGTPEEVRDRLRRYVELLRDLSPVVDLGCGRGELLELLAAAGVAGRGVEHNAALVSECRGRGLDVVQADLLDALRECPAGSLGSVFASHVAEHLPPPALLELLRGAHRALRPGGLLVLETPNPRSVVGFLEVYNRDLTHERPLHPETLAFLAAAEGFTDVRVEERSPVDAASRLQAVPADGLPGAAATALNENVARLNALLYGPQEYALLARR